ncbi:MAG: glycoside hydrolase family 10 protein [Propionibacteriaceae bacterium]
MHPFSRRTALLGAAGVALSVPMAGVSVSAQAAPSCPVDPHYAKHQLRAMWLASVVNIDWPSAPGLTAAHQKAELVGWLDMAVAQHHNAVVLQVRPTADAFWPSRLEPWSVYLTGHQGQDPGWDPLGTAVAEAHARGLQLHAWFNPYRVAMTEDPGVLIPSHPARQHPDWVIPYGGKLYYNPGIPAVRRFAVGCIADAVRRYDLDAVHFDDYFYPYPVAGKVFDDAATFATYGNGLSLGDWRRQNVTTLMREMRSEIHALRPRCAFGVSPFGIWRNQSTDPTGSATQGGVQTYDDLGADTRLWVREGIVDYIVPQVYWSRGFTVADYNVLTRWWADVARGTHCNLYIGEATYKVAANADPNWSKPDELSSHLELDATIPEIRGNVWFSAKDVRANRLDAMGIVTRTWYSRPALSATYPWLDATPPSRVTLTRRGGGVIRWKAGDGWLVAIYRVEDTDDPCATADARNLVAVVPASVGEWRDDTTRSGSYLVTAVDRLGNESRPVSVR